jgi:hypothetical protein
VSNNTQNQSAAQTKKLSDIEVEEDAYNTAEVDQYFDEDGERPPSLPQISKPGAAVK